MTRSKIYLMVKKKQNNTRVYKAFKIDKERISKTV